MPVTIFIIGFIGMWILVANRIAKKGWAQLAVNHKVHGIPNVEKLGGISASFPKTHYSSALNAWLRPEGIILRPSILFRAYHPPILIRWAYVTSASEEKILFSKQTQIRALLNTLTHYHLAISIII